MRMVWEGREWATDTLRDLGQQDTSGGFRLLSKVWDAATNEEVEAVDEDGRLNPRFAAVCLREVRAKHPPRRGWATAEWMTEQNVPRGGTLTSSEDGVVAQAQVQQLLEASQGQIRHTITYPITHNELRLCLMGKTSKTAMADGVSQRELKALGYH